jgi:hypothetical protein
MPRQEPSEHHGLGQAEATEEEDIAESFYDLSFSAHKSRRYHERLASFYASWRNSARIVTAVSGSGAFLLVSSGQPGAELASAFVALWGVMDIIMAPDKKADLHKELYRRFTVLARMVDSAEPDREKHRSLLAERLAIEELEPPCKRLVDLQARNDECRARDFPPEDLVPLNGAQRRLGCFATFGMSRLERWKSERQRAISMPV